MVVRRESFSRLQLTSQADATCSSGVSDDSVAYTGPGCYAISPAGQALDFQYPDGSKSFTAFTGLQCTGTGQTNIAPGTCIAADGGDPLQSVLVN